MGAVKEISHLTDFDIIKSAGLTEMVDEKSVTLIGRNTTSRGVRLSQETFLLKNCHFITYCGRRNIDVRRGRNMG